MKSLDNIANLDEIKHAAYVNLNKIQETNREGQHNESKEITNIINSMKTQVLHTDSSDYIYLM